MKLRERREKIFVATEETILSLLFGWRPPARFRAFTAEGLPADAEAVAVRHDPAMRRFEIVLRSESWPVLVENQHAPYLGAEDGVHWQGFEINLEEFAEWLDRRKALAPAEAVTP